MKSIALLLVLVTAKFAIAQTTFKGSVLINCTPVQDQNMSGTCWSFAGLSFLESEILRMRKKEVNLSEMFVARHAYLMKIKKHLELKGKNFFTSGGQFQDIQRVVKEYGLMPEEAYTGRVGVAKHNHRLLDTAISKFVRNKISNQDYNLSKEEEQTINDLFDQYLGELPTKFIYEGKEYTAKTYAEEVIGLNMDQYVTITAYKHHPINKNIVLEDKYNWSSSTYYNVSFTDFMKYANRALQNDFSVLWDGDVTNDNFSFYDGTAIDTTTNSKDVEKIRNRNFLNSTSRIDHVMHIVGTAKDANNKLLYKVKNSWGTDNPYHGFLYMNFAYFGIETMAIVVHNEVLLMD